jgi:hypothetical protein
MQIRDGLRTLNQVVKPPVLKLANAPKLARRGAGDAERAGWQLPAHRVWLRPLPRQTEDPAERTIIATIYGARDEVSAIVATLGHFIANERRRWRVCPCGCGEVYIPKGRQIYFEKACENRARARRRRDQERKARIPRKNSQRRGTE